MIKEISVTHQLLEFKKRDGQFVIVNASKITTIWPMTGQPEPTCRITYDNQDFDDVLASKEQILIALNNPTELKK